MIKPMLAIAAAVACAGIIVLAPELAPKSAMAATQSDESRALTRVVAVVKEQPQSDGGCLQHWLTNKAVFATRVCRMGLREWSAS